MIYGSMNIVTTAYEEFYVYRSYGSLSSHGYESNAGDLVFYSKKSNG